MLAFARVPSTKNRSDNAERGGFDVSQQLQAITEGEERRTSRSANRAASALTAIAIPRGPEEKEGR